MAAPAPVVESVYPSNSSTGVPIGADILITFDSEIDEVRAKANIMVFGPDFDQTSGPDEAMWIDVEKGRDPFFLQSPGFKGDLQYKIYFELLNTDSTVFSGLDYANGAPNYRTRVRLVPIKPLAALTNYTVFLIGDPDTSDDIERGITSRTVYSTELGANTGDGTTIFRGGYLGSVEDQIILVITEAGDIKEAEYEWYYASAPTIVYTGITSSKYRTLADTGVEVRFTGDDFVVGDTFKVRVYPPTYMAANYKFSFTTGSGSIIEVPDSTSTSVLSTSTTSTDSEFEVTETIPENKETKIPLDQRVIKIVFNHDIDPTSITDKSVKINMLPALGYDSDVQTIGRLNKLILVRDNILYVLLESGEA